MVDSRLTLTNRTYLYNNSRFGTKYPDSKLWCPTGKYINGIWNLGNDYSNDTKFYGQYPRSYLPRITTLFPDCQDILHLFSGAIPIGPYTRCDMIQSAELQCDAHQLSKHVQSCFDIIYSDPPYGSEDATKYGTPMINRKAIVHECYEALRPNGFLVWLDTRYPMFRKIEFTICGYIGIIRSTNHRYRIAAIFQRKP